MAMEKAVTRTDLGFTPLLSPVWSLWGRNSGPGDGARKCHVNHGSPRELWGFTN